MYTYESQFIGLEPERLTQSKPKVVFRTVPLKQSKKWSAANKKAAKNWARELKRKFNHWQKEFIKQLDEK